MASTDYLMAYMALLLLLLPLSAMGDDWSTILEKICDKVNCGKGTCKTSSDYKFNYICECDSDWRRTRFDDDYEDDLKYLPCVIPNCTLNYSCMTAPPPAPAIPYNESFFDRNHCSDTPSSSSSWKHQHPELVIPSFLTLIFSVIFVACYWMYCGEGECTRSNTYDYKCECYSGYQNLLNVSVYPCYGECALGIDCGRLGIKVLNSPTSSSSDNGTTGVLSASSFLPDKTHWMTLALISMGLLQWK